MSYRVFLRRTVGLAGVLLFLAGCAGVEAPSASAPTAATAASSPAAVAETVPPAVPTPALATAQPTTTAPTAEVQPLAQATPAQEDTQNWLVYRIPEMQLVTVQKDLTYKTADSTALKMDVYYPLDMKAGEHRPAVFVGHGRDGKDKGDRISWGRLLAASGLVGITFNYRDPPGIAPAIPMGDIADVIQYVRDNAETLRVDADRLGMMTFSGQARYNVSAALRDSPSYMRALGSYYGWLDYTSDDGTSPRHYLSRAPGKIPPFFIAKAAHDSSSINESIDRFVAAAKARNVSVELMVHENGQHGFDTRDDDDRSREIIKKTIEFFQTHLTAP